MHRKPEAELLPLDTKLERTLRNLRKVKSVESTTMADQRKKNATYSKRSRNRESLEANDYGGFLEASYSR